MQPRHNQFTRPGSFRLRRGKVPYFPRLPVEQVLRLWVALAFHWWVALVRKLDDLAAAVPAQIQPQDPDLSPVLVVSSSRRYN